VATSGLRWIVLTLVLTPPWAQQSWALLVWRVPAPTPEGSQRLGRHQTVPPWARQMMWVVRRWWPGVEIPRSGDQAYSVHELGGACARRGVRWVAPLRMEAAWYGPAPPREPGTNGRPRGKGARVPRLDQVLQHTQTSWPRGHVRWDHGRCRHLEVTSGTAVWDSDGPAGAADPLGARACPPGRLTPRAYVSTCPKDQPRACAAMRHTVDHGNDR
jgi:hypothetical protein